MGEKLNKGGPTPFSHPGRFSAGMALPSVARATTERHPPTHPPTHPPPPARSPARPRRARLAASPPVFPREGGRKGEGESE